jgi:hypothetical protein
MHVAPLDDTFYVKKVIALSFEGNMRLVAETAVFLAFFGGQLG